MRIYLPNVSSNTVRVDESHADVTCNVRKITEIFTARGLYECENDKIRKKTIHDTDCEKTTFNDVDLLIDRSVCKYNNVVLSIDANHHAVTLERSEISLRRNAKITLIVEKVSSKIKQFYFETNEDISNYSIAEDFATLLSLVS